MGSFLKDTLSIGFSKIIIILFSLTISIVTARVLGPAKNGIISALLVYPSIFMSLGSLGIRQSTTYLLGQNKFREDEIKTAITQIWIFTSICSLVICFILMKLFSKTGDQTLLVILALIPIPFTLFNTYNSGIFLGKNEIKKFNQINWIPSFVTLLLTFLLIVLFKWDIGGYMLSLIGGPFIIFIILLFKNKFILYFSLKLNFKLLKAMLSLGLIYALSLLIMNLNYKFDVIMLEKLSNDYETGIYAKGANLTEFLWQIPMFLSTIVFARSAASKDGLGFSRKVAQLMRISFIFISIGSLVLWLFSGMFIVAIFGKQFSESVQVFNHLLPGIVLLTIYKVMNMDLAGKGKPWIAMVAMTPSLVINIVLNLFFIPWWGAKGAALASSVSYSVAAMIFLWIYSVTVKIPVREIISLRRTDFDPLIKAFKRNESN
ncbi:polysaccharide biosynthesis C-terminal domain-containing protein [Fluviicola chungangensis]|uniref:Oligosaccharide flippase family protein n=1 Tax=Fluviicola chungangensis TaxID=2597671 RepID=A0A556N175_9FLAO|nr:polysaccharide biosynthesis C-terminal domain-containing protein [Fluviicola chungangensis]TSJ45803.1 oligosaccharide flippase family protein [Fluviicola chungangensis]